MLKELLWVLSANLLKRKLLTNLKLIITENGTPNELLTQLKSLNWDDIHVEIVWLVEQVKETGVLESYLKEKQFQLHQIAYPEDDELHLLEILKEDISDFVCFFQTSFTYPTDYFTSSFVLEPVEDDGLPNRSDKYMIRMLRAAQQSKYGLGIVKKDIKRNFEDLNVSVIYKMEDLKSTGIMELAVNEQTPSDILRYARKTKMALRFYQADYKSIEYFRDIHGYLNGIKKDAPTLGFQNKENASGFPVYFLLLIWLSLIFAIFVPVGVLAFLVLIAVYILAIGLEALAISTIKKQGELLLGLVLFFPFVHHVYLFYYFRSFIIKPNNTSN